MIKINKDKVEIHGDYTEVLTELSSAMAMLAEKSDRKATISMFLSGFYMCLAAKDGKSIIEALEMFKEDTGEALHLIDLYSNAKGNTLDEKYDNLMNGGTSNE